MITKDIGILLAVGLFFCGMCFALYMFVTYSDIKADAVRIIIVSILAGFFLTSISSFIKAAFLWVQLIIINREK